MNSSELKNSKGVWWQSVVGRTAVFVIVMIMHGIVVFKKRDCCCLTIMLIAEHGCPSYP
jgi:hypothetical protein